MARPRRGDGGMPYGNKPLHFGHIGGVFVPADAFARFLRDRIGAESVRFVSGTDCFGSPINEGYRKLVEAGEFDGTIADYVLANHERQKATLEAFQVSLDIYEGSGIGHAGDVHQMISDQFIERLHESGHLKLDSTLQFYDAKAGTFLNGRQVQGHCPVQGCKSEHAYADECDLGHQYAPVDLIAPVSTLTGTVPEMRPVENWYFDLPGFEDFLKGYVRELEADDEVRPVVTKAIAEFLAPPVIFVKNEHLEEYEAMAAELPPHEFRPAEGNKQSFEIEFASIGERDRARDALAAARPALPHLEDARALPHHRQHRMGRARSRHRRRGGAHGVVLARIAVGAHLVHHHDQRRAGDAAHELARLLVLRRRSGLPVHRPGQPVLLRRSPAGAVGGSAPRRPVRRGPRLPDAPDHARGEPPYALREEEGLLVGAVKPPTARSCWSTTRPSSCAPTSWRSGSTRNPSAFPPSPSTRTRPSATTRATPTRCSRRGRCSPTCSTVSPAAASTRRRRTSTAACLWAP